MGCIVLAIGALFVPAFAVTMPPLLDYPNHYARLWLLAGGAETAPLSAMYDVVWTWPATNIGIDLVAASLGRLIGAERLPPLLLALSSALPVTGAVLLHRRMFGMWSWWQIGFALAGWGMTVLAGFMNFQISLGLALLAVAADPSTLGRRTVAAWAVRALVSAGLLVVHPFGSLFYAILVAAISLGPDLKPLLRWREAAASAGRALLAVAPIAAPVALFVLLTPHMPAQARGEDWLIWRPFDPRYLLNLLLVGVRTYDPLVDLPMLMVLVLTVYRAGRLRRLEAHAGLALAAGGLALLSLAMPEEVGDSFWMDKRLPVMALLTYLVSLNPLAVTAREAAVAACGLLVVTLVRTAAVGGVWIMRQEDIADLQRALAHVPAGAAVLPVEHFPPDEDLGKHVGRFFYGGRTHEHYATLVVPWRQAFAPTLFTTAGKQPVRVRSPWSQISGSDDRPLALDELDQVAPPNYARRWRERFEYVLVVNADMRDRTGAHLPTDLKLIADEGFARLFRVPPPVPAPAP